MSTIAVSKDIETMIVPKKVREADFQRQIDEIIDELKKEDMAHAQSVGDHIYTTEVVQVKYKKLEGYAGGQPSTGTRFRYGGGFFWKDSGGPTVSGQVTFSVPYKLVNVSVTLGTTSDSETQYIVLVPNTYEHFKLYVEKTMEVRQVNVYKQITPNSPKQLVEIRYPSTLYRLDLYAKAVR